MPMLVMPVLKVRYLAILVTLLVVLASSDAVALGALEAWDNAARDNLPTNVKAWLGMMLLVNVSAVFFIWRHQAARWVFAGFITSHAIVVAYFWQRDIVLLAGQVSLLHIIFWTPGFIALILKRSEIIFPKPYAIWACLSIFFYLGSMTIDVKDAVIYLNHVLSN